MGIRLHLYLLIKNDIYTADTNFGKNIIVSVYCLARNSGYLLVSAIRANSNSDCVGSLLDCDSVRSLF